MKKELTMLALLVGPVLAAQSAGWTPVQLGLGPDVSRLVDKSTDVYGLRFMVVGKNPNVYGLDIGLDSAIVDENFGGIQVAALADVEKYATGLQIGVLRAKTGGSSIGLQLSPFWCETENLRGGQIGIFNQANNAAGIQAGLLNWTEETFSGLSLAAVSVSRRTSPAAQIGVLWNQVDEPSSGLQLGLVDRAKSDYAGIQLGLTAWRKNGGGLQASLYNDADHFTGIQLGAASAAHSVHGIQLNVLGGGAFEVHGAQIGLVNISGRDGSMNGEVTGFQLGAVNRLGTIHGAQIGILNTSRACHGLQFGLINQTGELHGLQVGLLNLSGAGGLSVSPIANFAF